MAPRDLVERPHCPLDLGLRCVQVAAQSDVCKRVSVARHQLFLARGRRRRRPPRRPRDFPLTWKLSRRCSADSVCTRHYGYRKGRAANPIGERRRRMTCQTERNAIGRQEEEVLRPESQDEMLGLWKDGTLAGRMSVLESEKQSGPSGGHGSGQRAQRRRMLISDQRQPIEATSAGNC